MSKHGKYIEYICVFLIIAAAIILSVSQTIVYLTKTPSGSYFPLAHNFIEDYYYYLHIMRQGWEGNLLATSRLTPEVFPGRFVVVFFLLLGHIARIFNLSLPIVYTLARIIGGIVLGGLIWVLIKTVYPQSLKKRLLALIFVCFGTSWWTFNNGFLYPSTLVRDWTELDPIFRLAFIPHHLASKAFMILSFIFIFILHQSFYRFGTPGVSKALQTGRCWVYLGLIVSTILMGFTSPVTLATFLPVIGIWLVLEIERKMNFQTLCYTGIIKFLHRRGSPRLTRPPPRCLKAFFPFIIVLIVGLLVAFYHRWVQNTVFPWTSYIPWENSMRYPITIITYFQALGPALVFFLIAVPKLYLQNSLGKLLISWAISGWLMLFIFGQFIPLSNIRFLGSYQFIPIGIGAVAGIGVITRALQSHRLHRTYIHITSIKWICRFLHRPRSPLASARGHLGGVFSPIIKCEFYMIVLFLVLLGYFAIGLYASWRQQIDYVKINQNNPQIYLPYHLLDTFKFLDKQTDSDTVVLAPYSTGTMIPAFTHNRVVAGHQLMTQNCAEKKGAIEKFYLYFDSAYAEKMIRQYNVVYILFAKDSLPPEAYLQSLHLVKVYENKAWEVQKVGN